MLSEKTRCCGCESCASKCQKGAITMVSDKEGFFYPEIDKSICIECRICMTVCPNNILHRMQLKEHNRKCYGGYLKNKDLLKEVSSGGAATALSKLVVNNGGVVFGVSYTSDYTGATFVKCENEKALQKICGTKYIQSRKGILYKELEEKLLQGKEVLIIGLPCEIAAVKAYLGCEYDNLLTCELICHGPTSEKVQRHFIESLEKRYKSKVCYYNVRFKEKGWTPLYLYVKFENGKELKKQFDKTDFFWAFAVLIRPSCYNCYFKGDNRVSDITLGDFWGNIQEEPFWNKDGVSAIMVHTLKGERAINKLSDAMNIYRVDYSSIRKYNPRLEICEIEDKRRAKFSKIFSEKKLFIACLKTRKLIKTITNILNM